MKIEKNQIRVSGQAPSLDVLKNLKEGSRLSVKITERFGQKNAVLDISGKKVNAEFLQGVPDSGKLFLILDSKVKDTYFFRIADTLNTENTIGELHKFTVFNKNDLSKSIYELRLLLKEGINSIIALNKALLRFAGYTKNINDSRNIANLFNKLLSKGANYENLAQIVALIYAGKSQTIQQLYYIMPNILPYKHTPVFGDTNKTTEEINNFLDFLIKSISEDDKEAVWNILDLIIKDTEEENSHYGEFIFFEENKFKICGFIIIDNSIILSLNLSNLGDIDIIAKKEKAYYSIAFYCEKDETLGALRNEIRILESSISLYDNKNVHFSFHNRAKAIEKIIEIISAIELNNLIDVKA